MVKSFKQHSAESKYPTKILHSAVSEYSDAEPDLPKRGNHHTASALGYVGDRLYDLHHKEFPHLIGSFGKIAAHALKDYVGNDRAESRANDKKRDRAFANRGKMAARAEKAAAKEKAKEAARAPKPRRGIGSY